MIEHLKDRLRGSESYGAILRWLATDDSKELLVHGAAGSLPALLIGLVSEETERPLLCVAHDKDAAERLRDDLALVVRSGSLTYFAAEHSLDSEPAKDAADVQALRAIATGEARVIVTHPRGLAAKVPPAQDVRSSALTIKSGGSVDLETLRSQLVSLGFDRSDFVETHGEYAVRGGILDVFPFTGDTPIRIELCGDIVDSLRQFDPLSQRSIKELSVAVIVPDVYHTFSGNNAPLETMLAEYLPQDAVIVLDEPALIRASLAHSGTESAHEADAILERLQDRTRLVFSSHLTHGSSPVEFGAVSQQAFNGSVGLFAAHLADLLRQGYHIIISCDGHGELARMKDLLSAQTSYEKEDGRKLDLNAIGFSTEALHAGFLLPGMKLALCTEHEVFGRLKRRGRRRGPAFKGFSQKELQQLRRGDFVVHRDYGIGRFAGLRKIRVRNADQEVVSVQYEGKDMLYVNLNYLQRLQKYSSKEGHIPRLSKLGSNDWDKLKARVKARVKDIARDLIALYARRKHMVGFAFQPDTPWQNELEASFMYEDTFDQAKATRDVKADMETPHPMDRLICGDVGFGKTEVAVRAAFKSVADGKQVALLVPTTILAMQHYQTFTDRVARYGVHVQVLSRFKSRKAQKVILETLQAGGVDILIGTHRILSKDVRFKSLGLLIIDEEHRFGVAAKEKLRMLRTDVDTLSLTATPIPRTLHFSLMGARDLSIIATPPRNRLPIITELTPWNDDLIREAIQREVARGGQVYVVHDRVQNIEDITARLRGILPGVRFRHAHGQMKATELEDVMVAFLEKRFDVLVATKIIESGLDIPNVNTIVVNRADRFGMAELYQLRGRVGRSNVQAYAYLLTPPAAMMPMTTIRRLQALEEFNELGSGFNLAMRDLEIRGAGNLLGGEQSGFIETMGFETYTRILEEAIQELKDEEFHELFAGEIRRPAQGDVVVEADVDALIPDDYVGNDTERLAVYRRLYASATEEQLREAADELRDRFGALPPQVDLLFQVIRIRLAAGRLRFVRVRISDGHLEAEFPPETDTSFYESDMFQQLMTTISTGKGKQRGLKQDGPTLLFQAVLTSTQDQSALLADGLRSLTEILRNLERLEQGAKKTAPVEEGGSAAK